MAAKAKPTESEIRIPYQTRLSPTEKATIQAAAKHVGMETSTWIRVTMLREAHKVLEAKKKAA